MKKLIIFIFLAVSLFSQDLSMTNDRWRTEEAINKFRFTLNSGINTPMHAFGEKRFYINDFFEIAYGVVISSENDVGATYERPDFPLFSTGRFYQGEFIFNYKTLNLNLGRHLHDLDPVQQNSVWSKNRLTGDGITWSWDFLENWRFEHSLEVLPSDRDANKDVFDRILNYHAMTWKGEKLSFLFGEMSLYTGINQEINWQRSNPVLPYVLNIFDSYDKHTPGYVGDNENHIFVFRLDYMFSQKFNLRSFLYLDEFQIDAVDRETHADIYLWLNQIYYKLNNHVRTSFTFSLANPAMGWHPGPFTTYTAYDFELLPHTFGEINRIEWNLHTHYTKFETYVNTGMTYKALTDPLHPDLNRHAVQDSLEKVTITSFDLKTGYYLKQNIALWFHYNVASDNKPVYNFILQTYF